MTLVRFQRPLDRTFFNESWKPDFAGGSVWNNQQPAVNILATENGFRLELSVPGWAKEELSIQLEKQVLAISGRKENQEESAQPNFLRREFTTRAFRQTFRLPETIDPETVSAALVNGILTIDLSNKADSTPAARSIAVQ